MKLFDMVLGEIDRGPGIEDLLHHLCVTRDFLLIPCRKGRDVTSGKKLLHLAVGELRALDPRR